MPDGLDEHIRSYLVDDDIALSPDDPAGEVRRNTWTYSVGDRSLTTHDGLVAALHDVAQGLRSRYAASEQRGRFYAWYDAQAGQLRCSLTSQPRLPFGGNVRTTSDAGEVVALLLEDPTPGFISFDDMRDADAGASATDGAGVSEVVVWFSSL